jgi:hypothetical protein
MKNILEVLCMNKKRKQSEVKNMERGLDSVKGELEIATKRRFLR